MENLETMNNVATLTNVPTEATVPGVPTSSVPNQDGLLNRGMAITGVAFGVGMAIGAAATYAIQKLNTPEKVAARAAKKQAKETAKLERKAAKAEKKRAKKAGKLEKEDAALKDAVPDIEKEKPID